VAVNYENRSYLQDNLILLVCCLCVSVSCYLQA